jgi:hypothetical protein
MTENDYLNRKSTVNEKILSDTITLNNKTTNLLDAYRVIHKLGGYTWNRGNCYSRLDYVFISSKLVPSISKVEHNWNFESSDHAALKIDFVLNDSPTRGPGICKVNTNILDDPNVVIQIKNELVKYLEQVDSSWNPHTTLEFLKVAIRSVFSEKVSELRKYQHNEIGEMEDEINQLEKLKIKILTEENKQEINLNTKTRNIDIATTKLKIKLNQLRNKSSDNQYFRSKAKWFEYGEKSNKFFLNLLKSRQNQKLISKISNNGKVYNGQEEVAKGITNFYKDLYERKSRVVLDEDDYYKHCPKLSNDQAQIMDQELTLDNLSEAIKSCKDSSPGPDGIPYIVYKTYWDIMGPIILKSWQYSKDTGKLTPSHNESVITLLPKEGKDTGDIKNWRPITLSNCDSKIITKALTIKISKVLDSIIDVSQTAYIPGRSVADNLRSNFFLKAICKNNNIGSLLISLDAKKAFDSVDHNYIKETLRAYGFGENFIRTFDILYKEITARILVNGFLSEAIKIGRGVKQGDSLSCALFIICIDPLLRNINNSPKIKSINPGTNHYLNRKQPKYLKAGAFADDISVVCLDDNLSIQEVFNEYNRLTVRSGLELNADKTEVLRLNTHVMKTITLHYNNQDIVIETVKMIKICGLYYSYDKDFEYNLNVNDKIKKLSSKIKQWIPRHLTMEGKSLIIKTFGLSQLIYNMQSYGFHKKDLKNIESIIFKFIWSSNDNQNGIDRIKRSVLKNDYENGGMKITDVECLDKSLKLRQFIRAQKSNHFIATIQQLLTGSDGEIKQEYFKCTNVEDVCSTAQETLNIITDYNRELYKDLEPEEAESDKNLINEISSINLKTYLKRKNRVLAVCVLKKLNDLGITTLGELMLAYEYEENININKSMKIIINSFPKHLINIAKLFNEDINSDREKFDYMLIKPHIRVLLTSISTKDLQITLKNALNRIDKPNFDEKLGIINFDTTNIIQFRSNCKNSKLRNIYFRLIHNDFFTHSRMFRYKMTSNDKCPRCGDVESTKHLLWDCSQVRHIWSLFNKLVQSVGSHCDQVLKYDDVYTATSSAAINLIKIRLIQEMIQIERPAGWTDIHITKILNEIMNCEKYNATKSNSITKFYNKWGALTNLSSTTTNVTNQTQNR